MNNNVFQFQHNSSSSNTIWGGSGTDTISYEAYNNTNRVFVNLASNIATIYKSSSSEIDSLHQIENIIGSCR